MWRCAAGVTDREYVQHLQEEIRRLLRNQLKAQYLKNEREKTANNRWFVTSYSTKVGIQLQLE